MDQIVSAEIPPHPNSIQDDDPYVQQQKREPAQKLRALILKHMVHGPCGKDKRNAPCMYNAQWEITDVCHKKFPKDFRKDTIWNEQQSYAMYRRRPQEEGEQKETYNNRKITNAWTVPYSPFLDSGFWIVPFNAVAPFCRHIGVHGRNCCEFKYSTYRLCLATPLLHLAANLRAR